MIEKERVVFEAVDGELLSFEVTDNYLNDEKNSSQVRALRISHFDIYKLTLNAAKVRCKCIVLFGRLLFYRETHLFSNFNKNNVHEVSAPN